MKLELEMFSAEDLAALAIIAEALNSARGMRPLNSDRRNAAVGRCLNRIIYCDQVTAYLRTRRAYFEKDENIFEATME